MVTPKLLRTCSSLLFLVACEGDLERDDGEVGGSASTSQASGATGGTGKGAGGSGGSGAGGAVGGAGGSHSGGASSTGGGGVVDCGDVFEFEACAACCKTTYPMGYSASFLIYYECACGPCSYACEETVFCAGTNEPDSTCAKCLTAEPECAGGPSCSGECADYQSCLADCTSG